jgi:MarR family transcriptional regulator, organic hydroperoxide resistance regulator
MSDSPKNAADTAEHSLKLGEQMCFPLYAASRLMTRRYQPFLDELNITYPQYLVLMVLWENSPLSVKDIGEPLFLASNTLTPLLKRLEQLGLIERKRSEVDERKVLIHLSEEGRIFKEKTQAVMSSLPKVTDAQKIQMLQLKQQLDGLIDHLLNE